VRDPLGSVPDNPSMVLTGKVEKENKRPDKSFGDKVREKMPRPKHQLLTK
jgi:hypothetical protein